MRVSLHETASQRLQIYMNDIFTLLMLPFVCVFLCYYFFADKKTVRNEEASSDESGIKHQKSNTINQGLFQSCPTSFWFGKQEPVEQNLN